MITIQRNRFAQHVSLSRSNVSQLLQVNIRALSIDLRDDEPLQTDLISYILGHVQTIDMLCIINDGSFETLNGLWQLWHNLSTSRKMNLHVVRQLNLCGSMRWDANATIWLNRIFLLGDIHPSLTSLIINVWNDSVMDFSGLEIPHLKELHYPIRNNGNMHSLALAFNENCVLQRLTLDIDLMLPLQEFLSEQLTKLRCLEFLRLNLLCFFPNTLQDHFTNAIPCTVKDLQVHWGKRFDVRIQPRDLLHHISSIQGPVMTHVQRLTLHFPGESKGTRLGSTDFLIELVQALQPCRNLQYLQVDGTSIQQAAKAEVGLRFWELLSTWNTLRHIDISWAMIVDEDCSKVIFQMIQRNPNLTQLSSTFRAPRHFYSTCQHYLQLNALYYSTLLVQDRIPLALWPTFLAKSSVSKSILFEILRQKHPVLLSMVALPLQQRVLAVTT